jgi:hypothetical protein
MSARGRFFVTPHAVRRFQERYLDSSGTFSVALSELIELCETAHYVKTVGDYELWRTGKPSRIRLRIMRGNAGLPQVVTVVRGHDHTGGSDAPPPR